MSFLPPLIRNSELLIQTLQVDLRVSAAHADRMLRVDVRVSAPVAQTQFRPFRIALMLRPSAKMRD